MAGGRSSETMSTVGTVQEGGPYSGDPTRTFALCADAEDAHRVISELHSATHRVATPTGFGKGMGIAAPQIGITRPPT